jgi:hypothetical protein
MDEQSLERALNMANGEAIFAGLNVAALWTALIKHGLIPKDDAVAAVDAVLLMLEKHRKSSPLGPAPVDYARSRTQALLERCSKM